jgi:hypothetical protein
MKSPLLLIPLLPAPAKSLSDPLETHARSLMACALLLVDMVADLLQARTAAALFPRPHAVETILTASPTDRLAMSVTEPATDHLRISQAQRQTHKKHLTYLALHLCLASATLDSRTTTNSLFHVSAPRNILVRKFGEDRLCWLASA